MIARRLRLSKVSAHWNTVDVSSKWVRPNPRRNRISVDEVLLIEKIEFCVVTQEIDEDLMLQEPVDVGRLELVQGDQVRLPEVGLELPFCF